MMKRARICFYTRSGCHLCEEAKREILAADCADQYTLEEIDIESDPALLERYGLEIPVITINGIKAFKYKVSASEFKSKLRRLTRA
jgi:glutaredoxin